MLKNRVSFSPVLAEKVRTYLKDVVQIEFEEQELRGHLGFTIHQKRCISIKEDQLVCHFDLSKHEIVSERKGYEPLILKGIACQGYCLVKPEGYDDLEDFKWWIDLCLGNLNED